MNRAVFISILIHLLIFLILWKIVINPALFPQKERVFQVSLVTTNLNDRNVKETGYVPVNKSIDLPASQLNSEDIISEDEMEASKLTDKTREVIPPDILEPKNTNAILPGLGKEITTISGGAGNDSNFYKLSGIVTTRRIMIKYIPKYPKGYHVNTEVILNISVNENGNIVNIGFAKRGGVPFDEISLNAARKWKFEPLPSSGIQKGKLTFFYRLK